MDSQVSASSAEAVACDPEAVLLEVCRPKGGYGAAGTDVEAKTLHGNPAVLKRAGTDLFAQDLLKLVWWLR
jgi:hypothetical protein